MRKVSVTNSYNESMEYDKNGNIIFLQRNGSFDDPTYAVNIDDLSYDYIANTNKLLAVSDGTNSPDGFDDGNPGQDDYEYDQMGNLIRDRNKSIDSIL